VASTPAPCERDQKLRQSEQDRLAGAFAGIGQFVDHVTADIASAASYKD
jgi:hypothetical protein